MAARPDIRLKSCRLYFLPVRTRMPLKFGREAVVGVHCARVAVEVENRSGKTAWGWGETPLNAPWVWPGSAPCAEREAVLRDVCRDIARDLPSFPLWGHPMEIGHAYMAEVLPRLQKAASGTAELPWLAALACFSPFDLAVHDAYAALLGVFAYDVYNSRFMNRDLSWYYGKDDAFDWRGTYPADFFAPAPRALPAWHLVGALDPLEQGDPIESEPPNDEHPVLLADWIRRDGITCLKVKLGGRDAEWDRQRLVRVERVARAHGVRHVCADFNCMIDDPHSLEAFLDRLRADHPGVFSMLLYLEQPFPRDLHSHAFDVRSISARKPLFLDESAHDWEHIRLGRSLGWTGAALKTCKTQTGALLALCWAKAHCMPVMVQDLTNPMLAQIPHLLLAAHAGTLHGVETNAMQFYPEASAPEARIHPDLYRRRNGEVRLDSIGRVGFGYRVEEIGRLLPEPAELKRKD